MAKIQTIFVLSLLVLACLGAKNTKKSFLQQQQEEQQKTMLGDDFQGTYTVDSITKSGENKYTGSLTYQGNLDYFMANTNPVIKNADFYITFDNDYEVTIKVYPSNEPYFELPYGTIFPTDKQDGIDDTVTGPDSLNYSVTLPVAGEQFHFAIFSPQGATIYDTTNMPFVLSKQYVQFGTQIHGESIWGWGERRSQWGYEGVGQYTIWNYDNPVGESTGSVGSQTYGTHPMYLQLLQKNSKGQSISSSYSIVYLRTTYGLEMDYNQNSSNIIQMSGGPIELKFFSYDSPTANIAAYHRYVGSWNMQPFWSMGFQICRWGLPNSDAWSSMWTEAIKNEINFDVIWSDIDYMDDYEDFTISPKYNVEDMKKATNTSDPLGVNWVPIIDAGVKFTGDSGLTGNSEDLFIKSAVTNESIIGCVWPGAAFFVDFNNPKAKQFWINGLKNITEVYDGPQPSGIWLDMNEPASFTTDAAGEVTNPDDCVQIDGPEGMSKLIKENIGEKKVGIFVEFFKKTKQLFEKVTQIKQNRRRLDHASDWGYPWSPMGDTPLAYKTLSTNGYHYNQKDAQYVSINNYQITENEFHNLYGYFEGAATNAYLQETVSPLPFIITRSSFAGQGQFTQHWTGDNFASWDQLSASVGDMFNFQLFGIPMVGADVCGFAGDSNAQLCARWYQMGAWYPFYRTHNANDVIDQYPWSFPSSPYVLSSTQKAINTRYSLLKWYYSIFMRSFNSYSDRTVYNPLFFYFPNDSMAQAEAHQFMIGQEIMVCPILNEGDESSQTTDMKVYFPGGSKQAWYQYDSKNVYYGGDIIDFSIPFDAISPFFVRGGYTIAQQPQALTGNQRARYLNNSFKLLIALDSNMESVGSLIGLDDYSEQSIKDNCYGDQNCMVQIKSSVSYQGSETILTLQIVNQGDYRPDTKLVYNGDITIDAVEVKSDLSSPSTYNLSDLGLTFNSSKTSHQIILKH